LRPCDQTPDPSTLYYFLLLDTVSMVVVGFALTTRKNLVKAFGVGDTATAHWEFDLGGHSVKICLCSAAGRIPHELPELAYPWQVCSDVSVALRPDILLLVATRLNCAVWENSRVASLQAHPSSTTQLSEQVCMHPMMARN
jgi:hypothetical protein